MPVLCEDKLGRRAGTCKAHAWYILPRLTLRRLTLQRWALHGKPKLMWRIKAEIYVQALVRRVNSECIGVIARRGDTDAGGIYVRVNRLDGRSGLLVAFTDMNGERRWRVLASHLTPDDQIEDMLVREIARDPDMWVVEIEDKQGRHFLEEAVEGNWQS